MGRLTGLRTLLVRPHQGGDVFAERVQMLGATLYHYPVMTITPFKESDAGTAFEAAEIKSTIQAFDQCQIAIFVSRTAARLGGEWLSASVSDFPESVRYYAVGSSTASLLSEQGIDVEVPVKAFNSEGLLELPSLQNISGERAMIFSGEGGRTLLAETLEQRGALVSQCALYRRQSTAEYVDQIIELLDQKRIDLIIIHSGELLANLMAVVTEARWQKLFELPVLVPSERVANLARNKGFSTVVCAGSALPDAMVSALLEWYSN